MKFIKIDENIQNSLQQMFNQLPLVASMVAAINQHGGRALLVGGAVRDLYLNRETNDWDIEVHGITLEQLQDILQEFGPVSLVGKVYGVLRLHFLDVDWSVPRSDQEGRKPAVVIDPALSMDDAFRRRDLTINAMGIDLTTHELIDPFNGLDDLKKGVLRAPDSALFVQDPLRFYRVMQFISRFAFYPDQTLNELCARMSIDDVSVERIEQEFQKMMLKSERPSLGLRWLKSIGRIAPILPELGATCGVPQNPAWHPEGDVFEHSMQTLDAAAIIARSYDDDSTKLLLMYAALCHDLGKAITTRLVDGVYKSPGHDLAGVVLAQSMLARIGKTKDMPQAVGILVAHHMAPVLFAKQGAKMPAYKRLAHAVSPLSLELLADLSRADQWGRNGTSELPFNGIATPYVDEFLCMAQKANVHKKPEEPCVQGRDLLGFVDPGKQMGKLLAMAYEIQLKEGIVDKQELIRRILKK